MDIKQMMQKERTLLRFHRDRIQRNWRYRGSAFSVRAYPDVLSSLKTNGYAIMRGAIDKDRVHAIKREMDQLLNAGEHLNAISKDSVRTAGDLGGAATFLTREEVARGEDYYRQHTNYVSIAEPLLNCPSVPGLAFDEMLIDIATGYLGGVPAIGGLNLRKSFVNDLPEYDTLHFHCDGNSPRFVKFFFYLNDVDERGGPFCYTSGSHKEKFNGWDSKYRWLPSEVEAMYGKDRIRYLTAEVGDLLAADTTGFHRGTKAIAHDRSMLTLNFTLHPEYWNPVPQFKIGSDVYERFTPKQRAATDFLEVVAQ
jgi:ectoine hydroxylase-related dioxygenase (phytanoyl-CoA dioxygenase family)